MNGLEWQVKFTSPDNPILIDRTNKMTIGVSDPQSMTVYLADNLNQDMLRHVLIHELGHCMMYSYNVLPLIHKCVKKRFWIVAEEWICNILADYAEEIIQIANEILRSEI